MNLSPEQIEAARKALDDMDDYARMGTSVDAIGPRGVLSAFINLAARSAQPATLDHLDDLAVQCGAASMVSCMTHPKGPRTSVKFDINDGSLARFAAVITASPSPVPASQLVEAVVEWVNEEQGFQYLQIARLPDGTRLYTHPTKAEAPAGESIDTLEFRTLLRHHVTQSAYIGLNGESFDAIIAHINAWHAANKPTVTQPEFSFAPVVSGEANDEIDRLAGQHTVPEAMPVSKYADEFERGHQQGWNACRDAILATKEPIK